ncbi:hypothetical protein ABZ990_05745 [Streptomyces sp. NPDC046203]|uniref:hypothetical protein n=1 Tax=Streptomyces sp. NPDC046203 TaxID=3154602 RepID=UPI0033ED8348
MVERDTPAAGRIEIRGVTGNVTVGDHNHVEYTVHGPGVERDPGQEELLAAIRELRADLGRLADPGRMAALDGELAGAEGEIEESGAAGPGRLTRLRQALADAGALTALFASAAAVGESVTALLGG